MLAVIALAWPEVIPVLAVFNATAALLDVTYPANALSLVVSTELIKVTISANESLSASEDARIAVMLEVLAVIALVWPEVIPVLAVLAVIALACPVVIPVLDVFATIAEACPAVIPVLAVLAVIASACPTVIPVLAVLAVIALAWLVEIPVLAVLAATAEAVP